MKGALNALNPGPIATKVDTTHAVVGFRNPAVAPFAPIVPLLEVRKLMASCVFDNPATCYREWWSDGKLYAWLSLELIAQPNSIKRLWSSHQTEAAAAPFVPGRIDGDPAAMQSSNSASENI